MFFVDTSESGRVEIVGVFIDDINLGALGSNNVKLAEFDFKVVGVGNDTLRLSRTFADECLTYSDDCELVDPDDNLIAKKDNNLYYINKDTQETIKINSPEISIKDLQHTQEFLYIYDENQVSKFKLTF